MPGKPAARKGDMTKYGGPIVQGSATVFIGDVGGVACSACAEAEAEGNPVNPLLGAKVLSDETDVSLPGPLPFVLSRSYSSYQTDICVPTRGSTSTHACPTIRRRRQSDQGHFRRPLGRR